MQVLVSMNLTDEQNQKLINRLMNYCKVVFCTRTDANFNEVLSESDVIIDFQISRDEISKAKKLKLFHLWGAGFDSVDMQGLKAKGIEFRRTSKALKETIAEYVLMCILNSERDFLYWTKRAYDGDWTWEDRNKIAYRQLKDISVCIWGMGEIGLCTAELLSKVGVKVIGIANKDIENECFYKIYHYSQIDSVLSEVDYISLHLPLREDTNGIFNWDYISKLKPGAVIINTSRGRIIDENDLLKGIKGNIVRTAYLDTIAHEPITQESPLYHSESVVITPHFAGRSVGAIVGAIDMIADNIIEFIRKD